MKTIKQIVPLRNGTFFIIRYSDGKEGLVKSMKEVLYIERELENGVSLYQRECQRELARAHRAANFVHKADRTTMKNGRIQRKLDGFMNNYKKKGGGKLHKVKGEVLPHYIPANTRSEKSWANMIGGKEGLKFEALWEMT